MKNSCGIQRGAAAGYVVNGDDEPVRGAVHKRSKESVPGGGLRIDSRSSPSIATASFVAQPLRAKLLERKRDRRSDVVRDNQNWAIYAAQRFATADARPPSSSIAGRARKLKTSARTIRTGQLCAQLG